jgi:hypothetical protein
MWKGFLIFNTTNELDNGQLSKLHELKNQTKKIICGKLTPQFSDWIFIFELFHGLGGLIFHGQFEKRCLQT